MQKKIVVLLSGGMDSAVLLAHLIDEGHVCRCLAVNYGQKHRRELKSAVEIANDFNVPLHIVDLETLAHALPGSSQTDATVPIPAGHYSEESMKATVVPNRNMILLSIAIGHAIAHKFDAVAYAAHAGDHAIYPDCRPIFADVMAVAAQVADWKPIELMRPFVNLSKDLIAMLGHNLRVPFGKTWSCYVGGDLHCGRCGTCVERRLAFAKQHIPDPTHYLDKDFAFKAEAEFQASKK